jgi:hypothetical protein
MSCVKHENGTTAVEVEGQLMHDLNQWGLQQKHLICCVTDTAANMNAFGTSISSWLHCPFVKHHYCTDHLFDHEFRYREHQNTPTQLEMISLSEQDFKSLENILFVLTPFKDAQKALEGERYVNLSLLPLAIINLCTQLGICEGAVNEADQPTLYHLIQLMIADFNRRWGEVCTYNREVVRADHNRQIGIPTYGFWAAAIDPGTKKKLTKCLTQNDMNRVWEDITYAVLKLKEIHDANGIDNNNNNDPDLQQPQQPQPNPVQAELNRITNFFMILMMRKKFSIQRYHWLNKWQWKLLLSSWKKCNLCILLVAPTTTPSIGGESIIQSIPMYGG